MRSILLYLLIEGDRAEAFDGQEGRGIVELETHTWSIRMMSKKLRSVVLCGDINPRSATMSIASCPLFAVNTSKPRVWSCRRSTFWLIKLSSTSSRVCFELECCLLCLSDLISAAPFWRFDSPCCMDDAFSSIFLLLADCSEGIFLATPSVSVYLLSEEAEGCDSAVYSVGGFLKDSCMASSTSTPS